MHAIFIQHRRTIRTREGGGEGRDSNPRVVLPTAAGKPAAALAISDLSTQLML
jgi:hypothetical protein